MLGLLGVCCFLQGKSGRDGISNVALTPGIIGVVDDDPLMVTALERLLGASGFAVSAFGSAEAFLAHGAKDELVCLVLDISLGGMSGIELAHRLGASGRRLPIIFITAVDTDATRKVAMEAGCVAFLTKPFRAADLIAAIHRAAPSIPSGLDRVHGYKFGDLQFRR
jgi:FixJ family two-component response regulator